jgi:hypothetical protein
MSTIHLKGEKRVSLLGTHITYHLMYHVVSRHDHGTGNAGNALVHRA